MPIGRKAERLAKGAEGIKGSGERREAKGEKGEREARTALAGQVAARWRKLDAGSFMAA